MKVSIDEIDTVLNQIQEVHHSESLVNLIGKETEYQFVIELSNDLPDFIPAYYDMRPKELLNSIKVQIKKSHYPLLINNLQVIEKKLKIVFSIIFQATEIREELSNSLLYTMSKRKGEISTFATNTLKTLLNNNKVFASFGSGSSPAIENKPMIKYMNEIIEILKPQYIELLIKWETTKLKIQYLEEREDLSSYTEETL